MPRNTAYVEKNACMKPCAGEHRGKARRSAEIASDRKVGAPGQRRNLFGIDLIYAPESAELTLFAVVVTVMIGVAVDEAIAADMVVRFHARDYVDGERQPRRPRSAGGLVGKI